MRLKYISLRNYRPFESVELELPDGMVSVMGLNGSGKSSLMEAVSWALYGNQPEIVRTGKESIKREGSARTDPCSVRIEFDFEGTGYVIERSMKGKALTMSATMHAGDKLMARSSDDVTRAVEKLLGMDHKSFFISVFARQKELNALTSHPKHMRKKLVLRMLGIENIDDAIKRVREDLRLTRWGIDQGQEELTDPTGTRRTEGLEKELAAMKKEDKELSESGSKKKKELEKVEGLQKKLKAEMDRLDKVQMKRQEHLRKKDALSATLDALREKREGLETEQGKMEELEGKAKLEAKFKKTTGELDSVLDKKKRTLEERDSIKTEIGKLKADIRQLEKEMTGLRGSVKEMTGLGPESECPTCLRKLGKTYEKLLESFQGQIKDKEGQIGKIRDKLEKADAGLTGCEARSRALAKRETLLRKRLKDHEIDLSRVERVEAIGKDLKDTKARIEKTRVKVREAEKALDSLGFDEKAYARSRKMQEELNGQIRKAERELLEIKVKRGRLEERILASRKELERLEKLQVRLAEKVKEAKVLGALEDVFNDFKKHLISRIRPALASISSELIGDLTAGKYTDIELSEDYEISIRDGDRFHDLERFSGGEMDLANLCLRLAISEVIAEKHGTAGFGLMVLDEIFGSQDAERKRALLSTLSGLSNRFKQIFLITHVEDVKELMGNVIQVTKNDDGTSSAEVL